MLRVNAVSGFAIGVMFGVFAGVVSFLVHRNPVEMGLFVVIAPPATAFLLSMITLVGHPLYALLARTGFSGLGRITYEVPLD
ncbi:MAG: hypothetical protein AMJ66_03620 [Betaproteobacteria bacterium SG8_40]|jgi:hypothetical protein|nr:MAG: hypothetical protein AMJ66_03620 [Betaproteobacteria bacterium SG8_40]